MKRVLSAHHTWYSIHPRATVALARHDVPRTLYVLVAHAVCAQCVSLASGERLTQLSG